MFVRLLLATLPLGLYAACSTDGGSTWPTNLDASCVGITVKSNSMIDITPGALDHLTAVTSLSILHSGLVTAPSEISVLQNTLEVLALNHNYQLTTIPADVLTGLLLLKELFLTSCPLLTSLPDVSLPNLGHLDISYSGFTSVPYLPLMGKTIWVSNFNLSLFYSKEMDWVG